MNATSILRRLPTFPLSAVLAPTSLWAQGLEEIIVTAQKRERALEDVPISVSVASGAKWEQAACNSRSPKGRTRITAPGDPDTVIAECCDRSGTTSGRSPELSQNLSVDYTGALASAINHRATFDINYEGEHYTDPSQDELAKQDAYALMNLRLALEAENGTAALFVRKLSDEDVIEFSQEAPQSNALTDAPACSSYLQPPRTVNLQLDYLF